MNFKPVLSWDGSRTEYLDYPIKQGRIVIIWFKYGATQEKSGGAFGVIFVLTMNAPKNAQRMGTRLPGGIRHGWAEQPAAESDRDEGARDQGRGADGIQRDLGWSESLWTNALIGFPIRAGELRQFVLARVAVPATRPSYALVDARLAGNNDDGSWPRNRKLGTNRK